MIKKTGNKTKIFIRVDLLQPGDVILSRGSAKSSKLISKFTNGPYSHASLVISPFLHFEADNIGLGYTPIRLSKVERHSRQFRWLWDVTEYEMIDVFRLLSIEKLNTLEMEKIKNHLLDVLTDLNGMEYPKLMRLSEASPILSEYPFLKKRILRFIELLKSKGKKKIVPGMFCSELVAYALAEIGYNIFKKRIPYDNVSPNDLSKPEISNLRKIDCAKCNETYDVECDQKWLEKLNSISEIFTIREEIVPPKVKIKKDLAEIEKAAKNIETYFIKLQVKHNKKIKCLH